MSSHGSHSDVKAVDFGYNITHFLNFSEQLASRLEDHQTLGNCVCHLIGAPIQGVAALSLVSLLGGYHLALACSILLTAWCVANDPLWGTIYGAYSILSTLCQLHYLYNPDIYTTVFTVALTAFLQLGIGHAFFEGRPPNEAEGVIKGKGRLFAVLDLANEAILGTFHFYSIALLKMGYRPSLNSQVQTELCRLKRLLDGKTK